MERLTQSELQTLHDFVQDCYTLHEFEPFDAFVQRLVDSSLRLIPATCVFYCEMHPQESQSHSFASIPELLAPETNRLWAQHMNEHPVLAHIQRTGDLRAVRVSDFWSQRRLRESGLYHELFRLYGIEDNLCINVPAASARIIGIAWDRDRAFTDRERLIAELVRPHVSQAWRNAQLFNRVQRQSQMFRQGLDSLDIGVILCGAGNRVQFINPRARGHLAEYFAVTKQTDSRLPEELLLWTQRQESQLRTKDDAVPVRMPLACEKENKHLVIRLFSQPDARLLLMEEERTLADSAPLHEFDLTPREAEVLCWIARGKANSEIASILQMHVSTVKKHTEHIYVKLGVENRTAAASLAFKVNQPRG